MSLQEFKEHLIIDFEATCSRDGSIPREEMEIIEIGAVVLESRNFTIVSEFQAFVTPVRNPILTDFCTELTGIVQKNVDSAKGFKSIMCDFKEWTKAYSVGDFCSWGKYDYNQLSQDCEFHGIESPIKHLPHRNLKKEFSDFLGVKKGYGLSKALKRIGTTFEGTHHRGLDDARNIVRIVKFMEDSHLQ